MKNLIITIALVIIFVMLNNFQTELSQRMIEAVIH
jgi:ABC-type lipoprotein release transport system permease subunit